ncbi:MAG TPA: ergothioneine biosynthesis protein EgtB [Terriglobales bacterium]|nr:ergothioneine biosynthesis protein EgtB [Terriglobales bacterium]
MNAIRQWVPGAEISDASKELARRYAEVRNTTESICHPLTAEDQMVQSMPDASPAKWHRAHTTWFFETFLLIPNLHDYQPFHPEFQYLFNSYYKGLGAHPDRAFRGLFSRPSCEQVRAYREHVDRNMLDLLASDKVHDIQDLVEVGLNHEQQHQELILTDIKHAFWSQPLRPSYAPVTPSPDTRHHEMSWFEFDAGLYSIGYEGTGFAFDNEGPRHQAYLKEFRIASRLVTNGEYLQFIHDDGYLRPELWLSDGWDAVKAQGWRAPLYWEHQGEDWIVFTMSGMQAVNPHEPVCHVSFYEADAYARWANARLATEGEWEVVASNVPADGNFLEDGYLHAIPEPECEGAPRQMFGDAWEWTASPYVGYPGFRPNSGALGEYNGKFMSNRMVLRGGSCVTPRSHIRASYRNFFPPHARWQFSGIRLAK